MPTVMASWKWSGEFLNQFFAAAVAEADLAEFQASSDLLQWQGIDHRLGFAIGWRGSPSNRSLRGHRPLCRSEGAARVGSGQRPLR